MSSPVVSEAEPVLELEQVTKVYQRGKEAVHALDGVTLQVEKGEFVAVVGPSGSGKSTLLYLMGCMDRPTSGQVKIGGKVVNGLVDEQLARLRQQHIGFVFQQFFLLPTLTALENVLLPTLFSGKRAEGGQLLALVGLEGRDDHLPGELSGGEMQRVAVARALVNQPQVLLADEPTGNLDTQSARSIFDLFSRLSQGGLTVVVVTHNEELASLADRIVRLRDGKIVDGAHE